LLNFIIQKDYTVRYIT